MSDVGSSLLNRQCYQRMIETREFADIVLSSEMEIDEENKTERSERAGVLLSTSASDPLTSHTSCARLDRLSVCLVSSLRNHTNESINPFAALFFHHEPRQDERVNHLLLQLVDYPVIYITMAAIESRQTKDSFNVEYCTGTSQGELMFIKLNWRKDLFGLTNSIWYETT